MDFRSVESHQLELDPGVIGVFEVGRGGGRRRREFDLGLCLSWTRSEDDVRGVGLYEEELVESPEGGEIFSGEVLDHKASLPISIEHRTFDDGVDRERFGEVLAVERELGPRCDVESNLDESVVDVKPHLKLALPVRAVVRLKGFEILLQNVWFRVVDSIGRQVHRHRRFDLHR